jgi:Bacterial PH domain
VALVVNSERTERLTAALSKTSEKGHLLKDEDPKVFVRRHWAILVPTVVETIGGLAVTWTASATILRTDFFLQVLIWTLWFILLLRLVRSAANRSESYFAITSRRCLLTSGLLTRSIESIPLSEITNVNLKRSAGGRLLKFGNLIMESTDRPRERSFDYIPYPNQIYAEIYKMITPSGNDDTNGLDQADLDEE